jgi:hypothetical protein
LVGECRHGSAFVHFALVPLMFVFLLNVMTQNELGHFIPVAVGRSMELVLGSLESILGEHIRSHPCEFDEKGVMWSWSMTHLLGLTEERRKLEGTDGYRINRHIVW